MIKKIIFDVDDTLIPWLQDYWLKINDALTKVGIEPTPEKLTEVINFYRLYENRAGEYSEADMFQLMSKYLSFQIPLSFMKALNEEFCACVGEPDKDIIATLDTFSQKYELVAFSNYYYMTQYIRLQKLGYLKYFSNVYGADQVGLKPRPEAYVNVSGNTLPNECLFIGDNYEKDFLAPIKLGYQAVLYDPHQKDLELADKRITNIKELMDIL